MGFVNYVDRLIAAFQAQLRHPWSADRSGGERVWFLVIDPDKMRSVLAQKEAFRQAAQGAGKQWHEIDLTDTFGSWMASLEYANHYFARPQRAASLPGDFVEWLRKDVERQIQDAQLGRHSLLVLSGTESLFGLTKLSGVVHSIEDSVPGRLLVLFPGQYHQPQYRLLDARDGWNYLAVPILPISGQGGSIG